MSARKLRNWSSKTALLSTDQLICHMGHNGKEATSRAPAVVILFFYFFCSEPFSAKHGLPMFTLIVALSESRVTRPDASRQRAIRVPR
jgi:hypothetical protein